MLNLSILFLFQITLVFCSDQQLKTNDGTTPFSRKWTSPGVDYDLHCNTYRDCFNCTLSNCNWNQNGCGNKAGDTSNNEARTVPSLQTVFSTQCEDKLNLCNTIDTSSESGKQLKFGINFDAMLDDSMIPANYWCSFKFPYQYAEIIRRQKSDVLSQTNQFLKSSVKDNVHYEYSNYQTIKEWSLSDDRYIVNGNADNLDNQYIMFFQNRTSKVFTYLVEVRVEELSEKTVTKLLDVNGEVALAYGFVFGGLLVFSIIFGCVYHRLHKEKQKLVREELEYEIELKEVKAEPEAHVYTWDQRHYQESALRSLGTINTKAQPTFIGHRFSMISGISKSGFGDSKIPEAKNDELKTEESFVCLEEILNDKQRHQNQGNLEEHDFVMQYLDPVKQKTIAVIKERKNTLLKKSKFKGEQALQKSQAKNNNKFIALNVIEEDEDEGR